VLDGEFNSASNADGFKGVVIEQKEGLNRNIGFLTLFC
jgi:hypothetical protein